MGVKKRVAGLLPSMRRKPAETPPAPNDGTVPQLAGQALAAIKHRGSHVQIIASAGSGKTEVVSQRVADMLADPTFYNNLTARIPLGRIAEPNEVMNAVLFFVSPASDFITGQTLYLDGGITATQ